MIVKRIIITYLIFKSVLCVCILNDRLLVGKAAQKSCIVPTGHIHPQNQRLVNKIIIKNIPIIKKGKIPSANEKNIYSLRTLRLERVPPKRDERAVNNYYGFRFLHYALNSPRSLYYAMSATNFV